MKMHHFESYDAEDHDNFDRQMRYRQPKCTRCGSHDVRWRQQGGRWVLFSLTPGKEHVCPVKDEFDALD